MIVAVESGRLRGRCEEFGDEAAQPHSLLGSVGSGNVLGFCCRERDELL